MAKKTKHLRPMNFNYLKLGDQVMMSVQQWKRIQTWLRRAGINVQETTKK